MNIPVIVDLQLLRDKQQMLIDEKRMQANRSRISYDYRPGDEVLVFVRTGSTNVPVLGPDLIKNVTLKYHFV